MVHASPLHRGDPERLKSQPNSTGAFRLVEDTVDVKMMEANLDYWRDPPKIKPLIWEFVQDPQTRLVVSSPGKPRSSTVSHCSTCPSWRGEEDVQVKSFTAIESVNFRRAVKWSFDREPLVESPEMSR